MAAVAFVLKGYPRLSETFIAQEIKGLEDHGLDIRIVSLRHPTDFAVHPVHEEIRAPVRYLPEYLYQEPRRVWRGLRSCAGMPGFRPALAAWLKDLIRDPTPNRIRRFGQACVLAHELPGDVVALHAHFLHTPASVARYAALLTGLKWTCSAHAKDIWTTKTWDKREKLAACGWLVTCSAAARDHLAALAPSPETVELIYHGLDVARFPAPTDRRGMRDGSDAGDPIILLSVGRAVAKKGHDVLIDALAMLPASVHWRLVHIGGGELTRALQRRARERGIGDRVSWLGARPQEEVLRRYREADLFVLASRIAGDGDRDGLPNVLLEAQSQGLACIATDISAIPELIEDGATGVLVPPDDPGVLKSAIDDLIARPERRLFLGRAGQHRVRSNFGSQDGLDRLARKFGGDVGGADTARPAEPSCASRSTRP